MPNKLMQGSRIGAQNSKADEFRYCSTGSMGEPCSTRSSQIKIGSCQSTQAFVCSLLRVVRVSSDFATSSRDDSPVELL